MKLKCYVRTIDSDGPEVGLAPILQVDQERFKEFIRENWGKRINIEITPIPDDEVIPDEFRRYLSQ